MDNKIKNMNNHVKGILCIIAAAAGFSFMTFFVRISGDLPTMQKVFFRNAVALVIAVVTLILSGEKFSIEKRNRMDILMRCLFGTSGVIGNFYAIDRLDLSDANMLNKLSPFFAIIMSIPILKEKPSKTDVGATIIAFMGALFIIRPSGTNLQLIPALTGLYGGFGAGMAYVFVRKLGKKGERTPIIVMCFSFFSCLVALPFLILDYHPMEPRQRLSVLSWQVYLRLWDSLALHRHISLHRLRIFLCLIIHRLSLRHYGESCSWAKFPYR